MVQPEIKTLKDLAGKPFAISRPGALSQYLMFPVLERAGLAKTDISWVPIGGPSERRLALVNNRVKGALLHLDYALVAQRDSNVVELERVVRGNPDYPHELLVIRRELAEKQPQVAIAITRSIIEACRFMAANRERTLEIYRKYTGETDMKLAGAAYDALLAMRGWGVNGGMTRKGQDYVAKLAVENGAKSIPLEAWTDFRFQEEALKQIGRVAGMTLAEPRTPWRGALSTPPPNAASRWSRACRTAGSRRLITQFAGDARFRHVAVNREESAIGLCSGAFFSGIGTFALMGASGFLTCIYAITKINYTYQIPLLIGITLRGRPGDRAKFHQSNGLYLEPVMRAIDMPFVADRARRRHSAPRHRLPAQPRACRGRWWSASRAKCCAGRREMNFEACFRLSRRSAEGRDHRHLGGQQLRAVVGDHRRDRAGVLSRSLDEPRLGVRRRHRARRAEAHRGRASTATARSA